MAAQWSRTLITIIATLLILSAHIAAEWEVLNSDLDDKNDDVSFSTSKPSTSPKQKKAQDAVATFAKKTYQKTPNVDPLTQFQSLSFTTTTHSPVVLKKKQKTATTKISKPTKTESKTRQESKTDNSKKTQPAKTEPEEAKNTKPPQKQNVDAHHAPSSHPVKNRMEKKKEQQKPAAIVSTPAPLPVQKETKTVPDVGRALKYEEINSVDEVDIDCEDELNMNDFDCQYMKSLRQSVTEEMNMSEAGGRARQQLLDFMDIEHRVKRQAQEDLGSGAGPSYPDKEGITDGNYSLTNDISFNNNNPGLDLAEVKKNLTEQLTKAFRGIEGFNGVDVTDVVIKDGKVKAKWTVKVLGHGVSAYGSNSVDVANQLEFALLNLTAPLYNLIDIGGSNPEDPIDSAGVAKSLADKLENICETDTPCGQDFSSCQVIGYDEGQCVHKCKSFEDERPCAHGGECVLGTDAQGESIATCQCTPNWKGSHCQEKAPVGMTPGKITGVTVGAALAALSVLGCCCWLLVLRRRKKPVNMTYYGDDSSSSEGFTSPSSKIGTFVIDRPKVRAAPFRSFSPHNYDDFSRPSSASRPGRPRAAANL